MVGDELKTAYERLFARERKAREEIRSSIGCMHVSEIAAANLGGVDASEIDRWRRDGRVFSLGEPYQDC
jgi:hypothetical protein